jgi:hypothetical protein|tara:strand:+ start:14989 stop:15162 length:174 start_codon:yes stop_codon:yes gene_type:complete
VIEGIKKNGGLWVAAAMWVFRMWRGFVRLIESLRKALTENTLLHIEWQQISPHKRCV